MDDAAKTALFTLGVMHRLADEGLVRVGSDTFTLEPKGVAAFDQLVASGFRPLEQSMRECLLYLLSHGPGAAG